MSEKAKVIKSELYSTRETEYARLIKWLRVAHPKILLQFRSLSPLNPKTLKEKEACAYYEEKWVSAPKKDCRDIICATCTWQDGYLK